MISDLNIEIAHVNWGAEPRALAAELEESSSLAREYISAGIERPEFVVVSMLVDDKVFQIGDRAAWIDSTLDSHSGHLASLVDFVCFESDLGQMREELLQLIVGKFRKGLQREIERYLRKHGQIACSHDIALWHSFRLGVIGTSGNARPTIFPTYRAVERGLSLASFRARRVVSFVNEEDTKAEQRAREEILANMEILNHPTPISERLEVKSYAIEAP